MKYPYMKWTSYDKFILFINLTKAIKFIVNFNH